MGRGDLRGQAGGWRGCVLYRGLPINLRLGEEAMNLECARIGGQVRDQSLGAAGGLRVGSGEGI